MNVRLATSADAARVVELEAVLFGVDAWSAALVADELAADDRSALVAVEKDQVCGYAISLRSDDVMELLRVGVHPDAQRRGIARTLLSASLEQAREAAGERMLLEVSATNTAAFSFYAAAGFVEIDRRAHYYRDGSDAIVMELPLPAGRARGAHG